MINIKTLLVLVFVAISLMMARAQSAMTNVAGRQGISLNGKWNALIDPTNTGEWRQVWREPKPGKKTDFFEYSFVGGPILNVPGDFNTQEPELTYLEGTVWYQKQFEYIIAPGKRVFIHFGAVNYRANIYLNGAFLGTHEGGFTPFQFEITGMIASGTNTLVVGANNERVTHGIPGLGYDWFNYGGITRDVTILETPESYVEDYFIQLKKGSPDEVLGWVKINGIKASQMVKIDISELKVSYRTQTNEAGFAPISFKARFNLWSPDNPKLYQVTVTTETDAISEEIGFRNVEVRGSEIYLNGRKLFLKGINIHEEAPLRGARAYTEDDALLLLNWAKELGCNMVRLAHYPHNEHMVKLAEKMGLMVWSELPVYQHIEFINPEVLKKMDLMLHEMVRRDRNRCAVVVWSLSNETYPSTPNRNEALIQLTQQCRLLDSTRLVTSVSCVQKYDNHTFDVWDPLYQYCDFIAINEYLGWYQPWQGSPRDTKWKLVNDDKPVVISEFGGEALYGSHYGPADEAAWWTEDYQAGIYHDQIEMFGSTPNLCGVFPWLLVDYRSLGRMHPIYQTGWNRKGVISDRGEKKKAWYLLNQYYNGIPD